MSPPIFSVQFNEIVIIESLAKGQQPVGHEVALETIKPKAIEAGVGLRLLPAPDKNAMFKALGHLLRRCRESGSVPMLQVDAHGMVDPPGLMLGDGSPLPWSEVMPHLSVLNAASHNNLFLILACCHGAHMVTKSDFRFPAPFHTLLAPRDEVWTNDLHDRLSAFYGALLPLGDMAAALKALDAAMATVETPYLFTRCDEVLALGYAEYLGVVAREGTPARIERVAREVQVERSRAGLPLLDGDVLRREVTRRLADQSVEPKNYEETAAKFLMLDDPLVNRTLVPPYDYVLRRSRGLPKSDT